MFVRSLVLQVKVRDKTRVHVCKLDKEETLAGKLLCGCSECESEPRKYIYKIKIYIKMYD